MIDLILLQPIPEHRLSSFTAHLFRRSRIHLKVEVPSGYPFCDTQMELSLFGHGIEHYQLQRHGQWPVPSSLQAPMVSWWPFNTRC